VSSICYSYCVMYENNRKADRNQQLIALREKGFSYGNIARIFNISRQRVHQITSGYHAINLSLHHKGKRTNSQNFYLTEIRKVIFERDHNTCQRCGTSNHLLIHHFDDDDRNNELMNLILLCTPCHLNLHRPSNQEDNQGDIAMDSTEIKTLRKRLGLTQKELAARVKVDAITVSRWERNEQKPSRQAQRQLARLVNNAK